MSDMDRLYESMKDSAEDMSKAAVEMKSMMTAAENADVSIEGYGAKPSFSKQLYQFARGFDGSKLVRDSLVANGDALRSWSGLYGFTKGNSIGIDGSITTLNPAFAATDMIKVSKGDCFIVNTPSDAQRNIQLAALYDNDKSFIGFIGMSGVHDVSRNTSQYLDRHDFNRAFFYQTPIRIPQDGYVVFQQTWDIYESVDTCFGMFSIKQVSWSDFKEYIPVVKGSANLDGLVNTVYSAVAGRERVRASRLTQTEGAQLVTVGDNNIYLTKELKVAKGQFIHFIGSSWANDEQLIFTDVNGNFIGKARVNDDIGYNIHDGSHNQHIAFNMVSPFDGYVRGQVSVQSSFASISVTDFKVNVGFNYASDRMKVGSVMSAGWYVDTSPRGTGVYNFQWMFLNNVQHYLAGYVAGTRLASNNKSRSLKPITLRRGDVLVYQLSKGQSPILGFAVPTHSLRTQGGTNANRTNYLISPTAVPMGELLQLLKTPSYVRDVWWEPTKAAEVHYVNEDFDTRVYLTTVEGQEYSIRIMSREDYRRYRDSEFLPAATFAPGTISSAGWRMYNNQLCTNPCIVFKDEFIALPKLGSYWEGPALGFTPFEHGGSPFQWLTVISTTPDSASGYDNPTNTKGFFYHAGFYQKPGYAAASARAYAEVSTVVSDGNGNDVTTVKITPTSTSPDAIFNKYPIKVYKRNAILGLDHPALEVDRYISHANTEGYPNVPGSVLYYSGPSADTTSFICPVFKGQYYKMCHSVWWQRSAYAYFYDVDSGVVSFVDSVDTNGNLSAEFTYQAYEHYFKAPGNGYFIANAINGSRASGESNVAKGNNNYQIAHLSISKPEFDRFATVPDKNIYEFPLVPGLKLNLVNTTLAMDITKTKVTSGLAQILLGEEVLGVVGFEMNVSGTGTARDPKKGWNLKMKGANGKKAIVKFGEFTASNKWGLKSYYLEGTHTRDTGGAQLWRDLRLQNGTGFLGTTSLLSDAVSRGLSLDNDWYSKPFSTQGFPLELYVGGKFFGVYTLRTRGEPVDYLMDESNSNHIMMGPDYGNHSAYASWANYDQTYWTIKSPSMKGYEDGDAEIPNATVAANVKRFADWMSAITKGTETLSATAESYIDEASWVDYLLFSELIANHDGILNNVVVATWDGTIWSLLAYDLDRTVGFNNFTASIEPTAGVISGRDAFLNKVIAYLQPKITAKYKALRASGFLSTPSVYAYYAKPANLLSQATMDKDHTLWLTRTYVTQTTGYMYTWIEKRLAWLDSKWV